jgi:hypothetical protein
MTVMLQIGYRKDMITNLKVLKAKCVLMVFTFCVIALFCTAQVVYVTPSGSKYHRGNCRMVENVARELTLQAAIAQGYLSCRVCKAPLLESQGYSAPNRPRGTSSTRQCKASTARGTRCKHKTSIANGFCYQHDPGKKL